MSKSDARKAMLGKVLKVIGQDAYDRDHVVLDTLRENRARNHVGFANTPSMHGKTPLIMSLVDGSVKLVQQISSNSLPSKRGVTMEDFTKIEEEAIANLNKTLLQKRIDTPYIELAHEKASPAIYGRIEDLNGNHFTETWYGLVNSFVSQISAELLRLSPPYIPSSVPTSLAEFRSVPKKTLRPCFAPIVVFGFDKGSENIKSETHEKRNQERARALESMNKRDIANGYDIQRDLPVNWGRISSRGFDARKEKIPYPPPLLLQGDNKRKTIRYISTKLIEYVQSGYIQSVLLKSGSRKRQHRIVQITLDGHCLYPTDNEDIYNENGPYDVHDDSMYLPKMTQYGVHKKSDLPHGVDSPICDIPISIFVLFDDNDCIAAGLDQIYNCPTCEVTRWMSHRSEEGCDYIAYLGQVFCSPTCERYRLLLRRVVVERCPLKQADQDDGLHDEEETDHVDPMNIGSSTGVPTYYFIGTHLPERILWFMQQWYVDAPQSVMSFKPNSIGEFDFTTFHLLYSLVKARADQALHARFVFPENHDASSMTLMPRNEKVGVRIVSVDTDAFVLSMLATELLPRVVGINVSIHLVNNLSSDAKKNAKARSPKPFANAPFNVFIIENICKVYKSLFPLASYPASNLAMCLYFKTNDYLKLAFSGASIEKMCDTHFFFSGTYGPNLIIDSINHRQKWIKNGGENLPTATVILDRSILSSFVTHVIDYSAKNIFPPHEAMSEETSKTRKQKVTPLSASDLNKRELQLLYIFEIYADAILGKYDSNRTIPHSSAHEYGF
jgi:hypothetical protein